MYKQIFDYSGKPFLVKTDLNGNLLDSDLKKQGIYQYTEIMPPSKFYPPRSFDGAEWHGASVEEYENNNKPPVITPDILDIIVAELQMQLAESSFQLRETQKNLALTMLDNAEKENSINHLENKQAQIMLELAELKGRG